VPGVRPPVRPRTLDLISEEGAVVHQSVRAFPESGPAKLSASCWPVLTLKLKVQGNGLHDGGLNLSA
jgi:hypothetical protein